MRVPAERWEVPVLSDCKSTAGVSGCSTKDLGGPSSDRRASSLVGTKERYEFSLAPEDSGKRDMRIFDRAWLADQPTTRLISCW